MRPKRSQAFVFSGREGGFAAWEACDLAKYSRLRPCEAFGFRVVASRNDPSGPDEGIIDEIEAIAVDLTLRRAARWFESEEAK